MERSAHTKRAWSLASLAGLGVLALSPSARGATPEECVAASDRGQAKRDEGKLVAGRTEFVACAAESCPALVRRECSRWLAEVDERIPSVVISVKERSGKDVVGAEVMVDGARVAVAGSGRALQLDPGTHVISTRVKSSTPIKETVIIRERERGRSVTLFAKPDGSPDEPTTPRPMVRSSQVPLLSWVLGGVAVVGAGGFVYFWSRGIGQVSDLRESCSPYCSAAQIDDARTPLTVARISGAIGIVAALGAVTVYLLRPHVQSTSTASTPLARSPFALSF